MSIERWPAQSGSTYSITATASGSINTKGSYTQVTASTSATSSEWLIQVLRSGQTSRHWLLDIATGAGGAEVVQFPNMYVTNCGIGASVQISGGYHYPTNTDVASGTRIAARCQSSTASSTLLLSVCLVSGSTASRAIPVDYGTSTANSAGTSVDPGGVANTKGSYAQLVASTSANHGRFVHMADLSANAAPSFGSYAFDLATGAGGSEVVVLPDLMYQADNVIGTLNPVVMPAITLSITSGTRLAMRGASTITDATDRITRHAVYGQDAIASGGGTSSVQGSRIFSGF